MRHRQASEKRRILLGCGKTGDIPLAISEDSDFLCQKVELGGGPADAGDGESWMA
mgnify:CR=1 FL=1